jgi:transcription elongation factor Elf1
VNWVVEKPSDSLFHRIAALGYDHAYAMHVVDVYGDQFDERTQCSKCGKMRVTVTRLFEPGVGYVMLCPICALAVRNEMHQLPPGTPFQGELVQESYEVELLAEELDRG